MALAGAVGCGPHAHIPTHPASIPGAVSADDSATVLANGVAPVLYLQRDEWFPLSRVVAVVHPRRPIIAYHLLWRDDVNGAWVPFTVPTDEEIVWIRYDSLAAPVEVWTYWHGDVLHTRWPGSPVTINVQWGKHGSIPRAADFSKFPVSKKINLFWLTTWVGLPDVLLGRTVRKGPWCFCHGSRRYREFTRPLPLAGRLDAVVVAEHPEAALAAVFGKKYSRKILWPPDLAPVSP